MAGLPSSERQGIAYQSQLEVGRVPCGEFRAPTPAKNDARRGPEARRNQRPERPKPGASSASARPGGRIEHGAQLRIQICDASDELLVRHLADVVGANLVCQRRLAPSAIPLGLQRAKFAAARAAVVWRRTSAGNGFRADDSSRRLYVAPERVSRTVAHSPRSAVSRCGQLPRG